MAKLRWFEQRGKRYYSIGIPPHVGRELPEDVDYECEITDDGVLFRPVPPSRQSRPRWMQQKQQKK
jgi:hypothetical protein